LEDPGSQNFNLNTGSIGIFSLFETSIGHYWRIDEAIAAGITAALIGPYVVGIYQTIADV
jgi:hypothetical protein